jgi:hypothetical protein
MDTISLDYVADAVIGMCDEDPARTFTTQEIARSLGVGQGKPELERQMYKHLTTLGNTDFPYVFKGEAKARMLYGRQVSTRPNMWRQPQSGPKFWQPAVASLTLADQIAALREDVEAIKSHLKM